MYVALVGGYKIHIRGSEKTSEVHVYNIKRGGALPGFLSLFTFSLLTERSRMGHRVIKYIYRVGNQYAECEKQLVFAVYDPTPTK